MCRSEFLSALGVLSLGALACSSGSSEDDSVATGGSSGGAGGSGGGGASSRGGASAGGASGSTGAGGSAGTAPGTCGAAIDAQITCRHDHELLVTVADVMAGQDKTYDIQGGNATHGHDVTVTADMFSRIRNGETVEIFVDSIFQPHTIHLSCAGLDPHARDDEACN